MLKNDEKLRDIRGRCSRAKEELSANLHTRLRWVMFVHRQLADVDSRMVLQNENLRRLRCQFDLLRQLHQAPSVYLRSMIEVVRRRLFAAKFLEWANSLSSTLPPFPSHEQKSHTLHFRQQVIRQLYTKTKYHYAKISPNFARDTSSKFYSLGSWIKLRLRLLPLLHQRLIAICLP